MPNQADALDHQRLFADYQRSAFGPAAVDVGQGQTVHEAAFMLGATVFDQIGLAVARRRFAPIIKSPHRHALRDCRAQSPAAPADAARSPPAPGAATDQWSPR